ncbi:BlaI/MecI/CopY family transcriptional regulator [Sediminitomix flava]|uniref:Putative transcriptional regulator n=1 Tax=Sediminitomix flava TaxID=379075 RepID=A0A315Z742_SEDFL|nr:BlaI/MecI/CopY family transcriptional regulator [Sediminitomix flava]PWJ40143.1 putative transcriptional regulator [Sediminitomix flava]
MKKLTKAEEQIMQVLWDIKKGFVKEIIEQLPDKPAYNTVSTIVRILEQKEFIGHESFGRSHQYFPLITKDEYSKSQLKSMVSDYFNGSFSKLVSFFAKEEDLNLNEMEDIMKELDELKNKKK